MNARDLPPQHAEVLIIGAGQAGLALAHQLRLLGTEMQVIDQAPTIGHSWARRWDSLRLFTPAQFSGLDEQPFPGPRWDHPSAEQVALYLSAFARRHQLPVTLQTRATALREYPGGYLVETDTAQHWTARHVIVATGPFGVPRRPAWANSLSRAVVQLHSDDYQSPEQIAHQQVLVVGGGNTGHQIALELAQAGRTVHLAESRRSRHLPQRIIGRDIFAWLTSAGVLDLPTGSRLGRRLRANEPVIGTPRRALRRAGVTFHPRAVGGAGKMVHFESGRHEHVGSVIWATGYQHNDRWIDVPRALDPSGVLVTQDGITPARGLFTIGRSWQQNRGSALLGFVSHDARRLAQRIHANSSPAPTNTDRRGIAAHS